MRINVRVFFPTKNVMGGDKELYDAASELRRLICFDKLFFKAVSTNSVKLMCQIQKKCENININYQNKQSITPLIMACFKGYDEIVKKILLESNVKVNIVDNCGLSALCYSIIRNSRNNVLMLLKHKEIDTESIIKTGIFKGSSPYDLALLYNKDIATILASHNNLKKYFPVKMIDDKE
tara:strand:+ start:4077 stop:4613 length:537 start_codon:yes stop_codon:yes gene_type:complete